ncbi:MAG: TIM-barrel domain-containing protein [Phycisphaerales bacterium]
MACVGPDMVWSSELLWRENVLAVMAGVVAFSIGVDTAVGQGQMIGPQVSRFYPESQPEPPWVSVEFKPRGEVRPAVALGLVPKFERVDDRNRATIALPPGSTLYGLGGLSGPLVRNGMTVRAADRASPVIFGVRPNGTTFAIVADTGGACDVSLAESLSITTVAPLAIVTFEIDSAVELMSSLSEVTGRFEMPGRWALGLQQDGVRTAAELSELAKSSAELGLGMTAAWVPIGPGTWSLAAGTDTGEIAGLLEASRAAKVRLIGVIGSAPVVFMPERADLKSAVEAGHLVGSADGAPITFSQPTNGPVWPLLTREGTQRWWQELLGKCGGLGLSGIAGGPTFEGLDAGIVLEADAAWGGSLPSAARRGLLPFLSAKAMYQSFGGDKSPVRPQVFATDGFTPGVQRYSGRLVEARVPEQEPLEVLPEVLGWALCGQQAVGMAVPAGVKDEALLARWIGVAGLMPVMVNREPWTQWGPERAGAVEALKAAMARRQALSAYMYALAFDAFFRNQPMIRPLLVADPADATLRAEARGFMIGERLLAMVPGKEGPTPLPTALAGQWVKVGEEIPGGAGLPDLYVRRGSVIAMTPTGHDGLSGKLERVSLLVYPDESGRARGSLYEDSGDGYEFYRNQAGYRDYEAVTTADAIEVRLVMLNGGFGLSSRLVEVRVIRPDGVVEGKGSERGTVRLKLPKAEPSAAPNSPTGVKP